MKKIISKSTTPYIQGRKTCHSRLLCISHQPHRTVQQFQKVNPPSYSLVKYLFQINDISSSDFSKYDDPMTVSTNIITECKKLQIPCDFPPLKLKGGCGDQVLIILTQLASKGLRRKNFTYKKPRYEDPSVQYILNDPETKPSPMNKKIKEKTMTRWSMRQKWLMRTIYKTKTILE